MIKGTFKFWMDENASVINYKPFHDTELDIYPTFSVCINSGKTISGIGTPMNDPRFNVELYNLTILKEKYGLDDASARKEIDDYISFLMGKNITYDKTKFEIDYDNVSLDLNDYLHLVGIVSGDKILYEWKKKDDKGRGHVNSAEKYDPFLRHRKYDPYKRETNTINKKEQFKKDGPFKISFRHPLMKCFSMDISRTVIEEMKKGTTLSTFAFTMDFNVSLFQRESMLSMAYYLHYPNQLMRSNALEIVLLGPDSFTFRKQFWVDTIEVIRHRNSRHTPCNDANFNDDELIRRKLIKSAKCTPPHWPLDSEYKERCSTREQLNNVLTPSLETTNPRFLNQFKDEQPCDQIHAISFTFKEVGLPPNCKNITIKKQKHERIHHILSHEMKNGNSSNKTGPGSRRGPLKISQAEEKRLLDKAMKEGKERCIHPGVKKAEIHFKSSHYKEIKQIKDFCFESWVGNVGGYMGLFLGYAICQFPDMISYFLLKLRRL